MKMFYKMSFSFPQLYDQNNYHLIARRGRLIMEELFRPGHQSYDGTRKRDK